MFETRFITDFRLHLLSHSQVHNVYIICSLLSSLLPDPCRFRAWYKALCILCILLLSTCSSQSRVGDLYVCIVCIHMCKAYLFTYDRGITSPSRGKNFVLKIKKWATVGFTSICGSVGIIVFLCFSVGVSFLKRYSKVSFIFLCNLSVTFQNSGGAGIQNKVSVFYMF